MKNNTKHYIELYKSELIIASALLLISVLLLAFSYSAFQSASTQFSQLSSDRDSLVHEVNEMNNAEQLLVDIGDRFEAAQSKGFYGTEDRLSWGEALKGASQKLKLPNLKYSISPQEQVMEVAVGYLPGLILSQSIMKVEAELLHEGDLLTVSDALSKQTGLYRLLGCELTKEEEISIRKIKKNVLLNCTLAWHAVMYDDSVAASVEEDIDLDI